MHVVTTVSLVTLLETVFLSLRLVIAASGCGTALALKAALLSSNTPGKIVLLGTPGKASVASFQNSR